MTDVSQEDPHPPALRSLVRRVLAIRESGLVEPAVQRFLDEGLAGEVVESLRHLMTDIDGEGFREAYHGIVTKLAEPGRVAYSRVGELYRAAYGAGYVPVRYLLLNPPPRLVARPDEVLPDLELLDIPLGRRKAMARGQNRDALVRLLLDPHPHIVEIILDNPKVIERDLVSMAARRPTLGAVLLKVAAHPRWSIRYEVQRALVLNPYSPPAVAVSYLPFLRSNHLLEVGSDARLHESVRESARGVEQWRFERRARTLPVPSGSERH